MCLCLELRTVNFMILCVRQLLYDVYVISGEREMFLGYSLSVNSDCVLCTFFLNITVFY